MILGMLRSILTSLSNSISFSSGGQRDSIYIEIGPPPVEERGADWEKRGNYYRRALAVTGLPKNVEPAWMAKVRSKMPPEVFAQSQQFHHRDSTEFQEKQLDYFSDLTTYESELRQRNSHEMFEAKSLSDSTLETLNRSMNEEYVELCMYFEIRASSKQHLELITNYVESVANEEDFSVESIKYRHVESLQAISPLAIDDIDFNVVVTTETAANIISPVIWFPGLNDLEKVRESVSVESNNSDWP
ncbi:hypothetical protein [Haloarcula marina]|uniref:hypothetical protein n=1 Tax=Haloarcula marina TaxID=2961574 RepID=UPI0020B87921|nr:hypothetical protein [Halomicroarcula marina]